ncbi:hypothetical protein ACLIJJ_26090 [Niallia sp. BSM11]
MDRLWKLHLMEQAEMKFRNNLMLLLLDGISKTVRSKPYTL